MRKNVVHAAALLAASTSAQSTGCTEEGGNWYCNAVHAITYTNVGGEGTYQRVTNMDSTNGVCSSSDYGYSGSIAPLNEEVSWHVRGPTILKQFAAYTPAAAIVKKARRSNHLRRHAHGDVRNKHRPNKVEERQVGATVTATINGILDTWINTWSGLVGNSNPDDPSSSSDLATITSTSEVPAPTPTDSNPANEIGNVTTPAGWGRNAFYNADAQTSEGLVFLNHLGGQGSGVWDSSFGNSLSYAGSDGTSAASSPQLLECTTLPSGAEIVLMRNQTCEGDACGYVRPGTVAQHGWDGARKAFFFEFQMPNDGGTTSDPYDPVNMPAIWMLNAQIPRTVQYGPANCSCWATGCGEFDMFEVLSPGYSKAKSTLHGNKAGGDSNYFQRPENKPIKIGMVMYCDNMHIKVLHDSVEFPSVMDEGTIKDILGTTSEASEMVALFNLASAASD